MCQEAYLPAVILINVCLFAVDRSTSIIQTSSSRETTLTVFTSSTRSSTYQVQQHIYMDVWKDNWFC